LFQHIDVILFNFLGSTLGIKLQEVIRRTPVWEKERYMANTRANNIQIEYETFGSPFQPALLLIVGLGCQLIHWPEKLCQYLADQGYYVIRFDNRDSGLSYHFDDMGVPDIPNLLTALLTGKGAFPPYTLEDMADDAVGLLDALDIQQAHICGMSMGGMIAQSMAINHSSRVLSLISIYSTTGNPALPPPSQEALELLTAPLPKQREAYIQKTVNDYRIIAGSGVIFDEDFHKNIVTRATDRSFCPQGIARQIAAVLTQTNRKPALARMDRPALVIHGDEDPLVPIEAGLDTAEAIPGATFVVINKMGHELPKMDKNWIEILDAMTDQLQNTIK
jgi:pimeloyl-ACP methyl ester carboxylesterase